MKRYPGLYRPKYKDSSTGEIRQTSVLWMSYVCKGCAKHPHGGRHRESSGKEKVPEALLELNRRRGAIADDRPLPRASEVMMPELLQGVIDDYIAKGNKSLPDVKDMLRNDILPHFQAYRAIDVCVNDSILRSFVSKLKQEKKAPATINRRLAFLRRAFRLAHQRLHGMRPTIEMQEGEKHNARKVFFTESEFNSLRLHLPDDVRRPIEVAWILGWRVPSEILTRERRHVLSDRITLEAGETKNGEGRFYPLNSRLREILEEQERATIEVEKRLGIRIALLFHHEGEPLAQRNNRGTVKTTRYFRDTWDAGCKAAGLAGRITHDFRRSAARRLRQEGYDTRIGMKILGHKTESIYRRYDIITEDEIFREVLSRDKNLSQSLVKVKGKSR